MTEYAQGRLLTTAMLDNLLACWQRVGAPIADALLPGLSEAEMQPLADEVGLALPRELRTWWGWRNGVRDGGWRKTERHMSDLSARELGPSRSPLSLEQAIDLCTEFRRIVEDVVQTEPPDTRDERRTALWKPSFLPLLFTDYHVLLDTEVDDNAPVPVHAHRWEQGLSPPQLPSLGDLICLWIDAIDCGEWTYNTSDRRWEDHLGLLPWPLEKVALI